MGVFQIILRLSFVAILIKLAMATNHIVGGPNGGWDTSSDLQTWASSKQFSVGDNLVFQYPPNHNVVEVTKSDYDSCQQTNAIQSFNDGATTIPLTSQGKRYFICGTIGHCSQGMKIEIDTLATQISPASPATASPPAAAASPPAADSLIVSIIPSAAPEEPTTAPPAESPESPSPMFETQMETPTLSPVIPSTEFLAPNSPLPQHSADASASSTVKGNLQAFISVVLSFAAVFMTFF
ncbi:uclacyanin 1-like [Vicia villosa]|uniref:uclacyanin 1-like n=1 Tax=Vicia villosa TaxID=3911 RepID=UPI00273C1341|nr:uclacyanin 1-like [Vicia villosa]